MSWLREQLPTRAILFAFTHLHVISLTGFKDFDQRLCTSASKLPGRIHVALEGGKWWRPLPFKVQ
jgi:hypothetical protein